MSIVVALSGQVAAGKSAVSVRLAARLAVPRVSFGDAVRRVAMEQGLPTDRAVLQDLGEELIAAGWESFCHAVLEQAPWRPGQSLVVDGVRHLGAIAALQRLVQPSRLRVVFLESPPEARKLRLATKGATSAEAIMAVDEHRNERELPSVRQVADLVVANDGDIEQLVTSIFTWLCQRSHARS
jgi:dephospho-CoA kinase